MKRYVIEFANDIIRANEKSENFNNKYREISNVVWNCEHGFATSFEAMKRLAEIANE